MEECCPDGSRDASEIVRYFDERVERYGKRQKEGLPEESRTILEALNVQGVAGKSLLENWVWCWGLTFELLRLGVSKAQGVDLSPEMVASARDMTSRMGYSAKSTFEVGDGAEVGRA